jgi:hypothetical protein
MATTEARWDLDGEPVDDLGAFFSANRDGLTVDDATRIATMKPGDEMVLGGGAFAELTLRRVA